MHWSDIGIHSAKASVVIKDLRLKDEDKDEDLKIGPPGFSRTRTFLKDNNTAVRQYTVRST